MTLSEKNISSGILSEGGSPWKEKNHKEKDDG
jgi:hypothetical protein